MDNAVVFLTEPTVHRVKQSGVMNPSRLIPLFVLLSILSRVAHAADIIVMISGGFKSTYEAMAPEFEKKTGSHLVLVPGPSEGSTKEAIPNRLARGEAVDVLIMVGPALDKLVRQGDALGNSEMELALSPIGLCVRAGTPVPDISTVNNFRQVLLNARSIVYSDSSSGVYIASTLFKRLGIQSQVQGKAHQIPGTPVAEIVAQGKAEIGFQEVAEILPVQGAIFVGRIPHQVQYLTRFSAAVDSRSKNQALARQLIEYLASPTALPVLEKMGLEPPRK
jgi:molybdate transport system substrate-binding protein